MGAQRFTLAKSSSLNSLKRGHLLVWYQNWRVTMAMTSMRLIHGVAATLVAVFGNTGFAQQPAPTAPPVATFRSSVDLVRVSAVVRDRRGRFVRDLAVRD